MGRSLEVELGPVTEQTFQEFRVEFGATFGFVAQPAQVDRSREWTEYERLVAARAADGSIVGTSGSFTFDISLPGGRSAGCAGVTAVSVRADHRRRGLLTRMMGRLLDDAAARGEPFAALWASESPIYGRYGFGAAVPTVDLTLDRRHAQLSLDGPVEEVQFVDVEVARPAFATLHERFRRVRGGVMSRSHGWWSRLLAPGPHATADAGPLRLGLLPDRGYVVYHLTSDWTDEVPQGVVHVEDLVALDPQATAALWRFVTDTDLSQSTVAVRRPPDDPVLAMLVDPARAKVTSAWPLYLRLIDLPAALGARAYLGVERIVLDVEDGFRPENSGRWRLETSDGQATCRRTDDDPELVLGVDTLAAVMLGGVRTTALHAAGQVRGAVEAAARLDRLFAAEHAPSSDMMF